MTVEQLHICSQMLCVYMHLLELFIILDLLTDSFQLHSCTDYQL